MDNMKSESEPIGSYKNMFMGAPMNNMSGQIPSPEQSSNQDRSSEDHIEGLAEQVMILTQETNALKQRQFFGFTSPNDWTDYSCGITAVVDFSHLNLQRTPLVQCSLIGNDALGGTRGGSCIYRLTNRGFEVYVCYRSGRKPTAAEARELKWYLSYTVTSMD